MVVVDARDGLPRHPTKKWGKRLLKHINQVIVHQAASRGNMFSVAKYHVTPSEDRDGDGIATGWERNHISPTGCPAICYHYGIEDDGRVYLMNDLEDIVWHAGGHNMFAIGIVLFCDASGPSHDGLEEPTDMQLDALEYLLDELYYNVLKTNTIKKSKFVGHCDVDPRTKENCPGTIAMERLKEWKELA